MEKFFSVVIELENGERKTVRIAGEGPGEAFQQAKAMPGVRRVGKVSAADQHAPPHRAAASDESQRPAHGSSHSGQHRAREQGAGPQRGTAEYANAGPRVVMHARRAGSEQPFKHLYVPPERLSVHTPPKPVERPVTAPVQPKRPVAVAPPEPAPQVPEAEEKPEYRIVKSRRQGGSPYLLQRGIWVEAKGKRVFQVDWEKGFDDREKAELHQQWVGDTEQELAEVEHTEVEQHA